MYRHHRDLHGLTHSVPTRRSSDLSLPVKVNLNTETAWQGTANTAAIFSVRLFPDLNIGEPKISDCLRKVLSNCGSGSGEADHYCKLRKCEFHGIYLCQGPFNKRRGRVNMSF